MSLRRSERSRKKRWKIKQTRSAIRDDPYKAGKDLLNPKCTSTLHVDQASRDNHKARLTNDTLYNVPLTSLEGLPPPPNNIKQFPKAALKFHDFVKLLNSRKYLSFPHIYFLYPQFCHPYPMAICKGTIYP